MSVRTSHREGVVGYVVLGAKPGDWVRRHAADAHPYDARVDSGWAFT